MNNKNTSNIDTKRSLTYLHLHDAGVLSKHDILSGRTACGVQHMHALEQGHILRGSVSIESGRDFLMLACNNEVQ